MGLDKLSQKHHFCDELSSSFEKVYVKLSVKFKTFYEVSINLIMLKVVNYLLLFLRELI